MSTPPAPARLHVLFARDAPIGVVLRRGPSKWVRLILWRTDTDTFEPGQWLVARVYEDLMALSPNGKLLAYCAMDPRKRRAAKSGYDGWIAVSRPPYFTALAWWFTDRGARGGNVAFDGNSTLHHTAGELAPGHTLPAWFRVGSFPIGRDGPSARGWRHFPASPEVAAKRAQFRAQYPQVTEEWAASDYPMPCEKPIADSRFAVELHYKGWSWKPRLCNRQTGAERELNVEQVEVDPVGRLILVRGGKLFTATVHDDLTLTETELADFNDMTFEPIPPPAWATQWPSE